MRDYFKKKFIGKKLCVGRISGRVRKGDPWLHLWEFLKTLNRFGLNVSSIEASGSWEPFEKDDEFEYMIIEELEYNKAYFDQ